MRTLMSQVREFHTKHGFPTQVPLQITQRDVDEGLRSAAAVNLMWADCLMPASDDPNEASLIRTRASLVLEETGEMLEALAMGDEKGLLDALADLAYVVAGTAVSYGLPLAEATDEVHRSNMTKQVQQDRPGHPGKSVEEGYSPPDLDRVLRENRQVYRT